MVTPATTVDRLRQLNTASLSFTIAGQVDLDFVNGHALPATMLRECGRVNHVPHAEVDSSRIAAARLPQNDPLPLSHTAKTVLTHLTVDHAGLFRDTGAAA